LSFYSYADYFYARQVPHKILVFLLYFWFISPHFLFYICNSQASVTGKIGGQNKSVTVPL